MVGRRGGEDMAKWIKEHIEATIRRGVPARWRWDWSMWGWLMEKANILELPRQDPELF